jgi:predicted metal-dependent peptidase
MDLERRIAKAKTALILEHPFFGNLAMNMPFEISEDVPTAATNGSRVLFNPNFCEPLKDEELLFLVAHEVCHPMFEHIFRLNGRDPKRWNYAGDAVINPMLEDEGIGKFIEGGVMDRDLLQRGGGTTDGVYNLLPPMPEDGDGGYGDGMKPYDDIEDAGENSSPAEIEQKKAEWKVKVAQAAQSAKMMGKLSAGLERFVGDLMKPRVNWKDVMQRFLVKQRTDARTWARPNRRFLSQGMYLPSVSGEALGELCFAIDTSGSIGEEELTQFASEITKVYQDLSPTKIHVIYFDSVVCHYDCFEDDEPVIKPHGGGGTAFSPIFRFMQDKDIDPVACVVLTDLCCDDFGDEPAYPVLWVSNMKGEAPWGEIVYMEGVDD